ncbi:glutamine synthetase [Nakamurella antarctica]|uniref:Glutamine synthetase n=1 Tax=Nakamurella antarctica TaxID=1902245 RepID=A0A3G8ZIS7_9ACTN|nr:glutamine synthetase family protein [Nakamurella antarctica]AZI57233.1 glutamine synthetase [Nakamurella antarctica]
MTEHPRSTRMLTIDALTDLINDGGIDTVVVAFTDMQGRLQGKRLHAPFFLSDVLGHNTEGCNYLLAVDVEMNTIPGYAISSWETGYGDMIFRLDLDTIRLLTWIPSTVMIQCDLTWLDGTLVPPSPRSVLQKQVDRAAAAGFKAFAGTELEFIVFEDTYEQAWDSGYRNMTPSNQYNVDYSILGTTRVEPLLRDIRNSMYAAGLIVESAKGECNFGQHEIAFRFAEVMTTADDHSVYKNGAKEIASNHGKSLTFMAKYDQREGNSCHIHLSLRGLDGELVFVDSDTGGRSALYEQFIAGVLATMCEFTLLYAPNINSYKRFAEGSFAPTTVAWGLDNRTCSVRLVGNGQAARLENRLPGGDVNPYMAIAAMMAGGLHGIESGLVLEEATAGNAYASGKPKVPTTLREARDLFNSSAVARAALGDDVVEHYVHAADTELAAFEAAVTDWELRRGFERL